MSLASNLDLVDEEEPKQLPVETKPRSITTKKSLTSKKSLSSVNNLRRNTA